MRKDSTQPKLILYLMKVKTILNGIKIITKIEVKIKIIGIKIFFRTRVSLRHHNAGAHRDMLH